MSVIEWNDPNLWMCSGQPKATPSPFRVVSLALNHDMHFFTFNLILPQRPHVQVCGHLPHVTSFCSCSFPSSSCRCPRLSIRPPARPRSFRGCRRTHALPSFSRPALTAGYSRPGLDEGGKFPLRNHTPHGMLADQRSLIWADT